MLLPQDDLALLLKEFGVEDFGKLILKKTAERIVKASVFSEAPQRVKITSDLCKDLCEKVGLKYLPGYENRVIERVTTTEAPDRYGDIVRAKGIDNANYRKNAVVLFAHEDGNFPVGKSLREWIDSGIKGWRSWDLYLGNEVDPSGRSDLTFRMVDSGAMTGGSISFMPRQVKHDHTLKEREEINLGKYGVEYLICEKLEHSACSVPANPEALSNCLKLIQCKKFFNREDIDRMAKEKMLDEQFLNVFADVLGTPRIISVPSLHEEPPVEKVADVIVLRPYPNEHACRLVDPSKFSEFRRGTRKHNGKLFSIIFGKYNDEDRWGEQAYRYTKDTWTEAEARAHCTDHDGISFEPATEKSVESAIIINLDVSQAQKELCEISQHIKIFNGILEAQVKAFEDKFSQLMATTQRALSALEQRIKTVSLYDKKEIEDALKIPPQQRR